MHITRMAGLINSVALILVFKFCFLAFTNGLNCTNRCCYYYSNVPKNVTTISCNPQGMDINWLCQIHTPPNDTNVSVQWYKAGRGIAESDVMADGELLSELSGKYSFTIDRQVLAVNNHSELNGLFWDRFVLTIHNFNSSTDDGYYWCQIVANGTCPLEPSPTGYLALDQFPVEKCPYNLLDFTDSVVPPICAEGTFHAEEQTTPTRASDERVNNHTSSESILIASMTVILYGIIGGLFLIIIFLLLIIVACTVCNVRSRKMNKAVKANKDKHYTGPSLNDYNDQPTKSDNDAIEMDAPRGTKDTSAGRKQPLLPPSNTTQPIQEPATSTIHVLTSSNDEVKYAQPGAVCQPPVNPLEVSTHSEPTQYQGLRASGVNVISAYHIPQVGKHEYGSGGVKADPMYANLPK